MNPKFEDHILDSRRLEDRIRHAQHHVKLGRETIKYYKALVEERRVEGHDTKIVEDLLATLERTQKVFENDLAELERQLG